ncbi:uncharacterized protein LOC127239731 isoform X2 [Andrographis paniculata]|uniref:uncharacterized protein LOC127239731 isoform X2 n=1 Tax=Andrographis paniculata TaxID=175694 RepID=UPI0021E723F5|nr:uncharacterized protein LOC127239731 isoform X2 [Andrographis paniculata]XP_051113975.1 uncharacterized protein LOC127239731 isoform X2 [Andrographis paniculata]
MSDAPSPAVIEFRRLYAADRELYTVLVRELARNPSESLIVMGLWLWFEREGIPEVIGRISSFCPKLINRLAEESVLCLDVVRNPNPGGPTKPVPIPVLCAFLETKLYPLFLCSYYGRMAAFHEVHKLVSNIYIPAMSDIMERARRGELIGPGRALSLSRLNVDFGPAEDIVDVLDREMDRYERMIYVLFPANVEPAITEVEVRQFLTMWFGLCVDTVHVHEAGPAELPVYARICLRSTGYLKVMLDRTNSNRVLIDGKTVWLLRSLPRDNRIPMPCGCLASECSITAPCPHRRNL